MGLQPTGDTERSGDMLAAARDRLVAWLISAVAPLWATSGIDPATHGFREALDRKSGAPLDTPSRPRVPPRQIYAFIEMGRLGWAGDWRALVRGGLADWQARFLDDDSTIRQARDPLTGTRPFDLYDQAFALFAYAAVARAMPEQRQAAEADARALLDTLKSRLRRFDGGFEEDLPGRLPLRANPHMHLLEAALAWESVSREPVWTALADDMAELALTCFIDPCSGALREFFDDEWRVMPNEADAVIEPGHQFEWSWLLTLWGRSRGRADALDASRRLYRIGRDHGICRNRCVAIQSLSASLEVTDPLARLWPQTEWLKAALLMLEDREVGADERARLGEDAVHACRAIEAFLETERPGTWFDKIDAEGVFVDEPSPASSLYHLVCAISELDRIVGEVK